MPGSSTCTYDWFIYIHHYPGSYTGYSLANWCICILPHPWAHPNRVPCIHGLEVPSSTLRKVWSSSGAAGVVVLNGEMMVCDG